VAGVEEYRDPQLWISNWRLDILFLIAICALGGWAAATLWRSLTPRLKVTFSGIAICAVLGVAASYLFGDILRFLIVSELQPARWLLYMVLFCCIAFGAAGAQALHARNTRLAAVCFSLLAGLVVSAAILREPPHRIDAATKNLAEWAKNDTWAGSVFAFPDVGRALTPGDFRALSLRGIWVDWQSGEMVNKSESLAREWWERWHQTMQGPYSAARLQRFSDLPVDYVVLHRRHQLSVIHPVYSNRDFVVYDNQDLRSALARNAP
jgi:hypothetical protein